MCGIGVSEVPFTGDPCECYRKGAAAAALRVYAGVTGFIAEQVGIIDRGDYPPSKVVYSRHVPETLADYRQLWAAFRAVHPEAYEVAIRHMAWTKVTADSFLLDPRVKAILEEAKLSHVINVYRATDRELLAISGIGDYHLKEIRVAVWRHGVATTHAFDPANGERYAHPVEALRLTEPILRLLAMHKILTIGQLSGLSDDEILAIVGNDYREGTVRTIRSRIHAYITL